MRPIAQVFAGILNQQDAWEQMTVDVNAHLMTYHCPTTYAEAIPVTHNCLYWKKEH